MINKCVPTCLFLLLMLFVGCDNINNPENTENGPLSSSELESLSIDPAFDYATTKPLEIRLNTLNSHGNPLKNVRFDVFVDLKQDGLKLLTSGITQADGMLVANTTVPKFVEDVLVTTEYIGLPDSIYLPVNGNTISHDYSKRTSSALNKGAKHTTSTLNASLADFATLGGWNSSGVPDYLEAESDEISDRILALVDASLPESDPVPSAHPEYLAEGNDMDVRLSEEADVWVTFVHEGAGWRNALGFYTYDLSSPPTSAPSSSMTMM